MHAALALIVHSSQEAANLHVRPTSEEGLVRGVALIGPGGPELVPIVSKQFAQ